MQWRKRLKLEYVVGSLKGSQLIRVYRLFFAEDLSHITLKRREGERTHANSKLGSNVIYNTRKDNYHLSEAQELPGEVKYSNVYNDDIDSNGLTENGEDQVQPGFFVDGLWVPESDIQTIANENQVPFQFFHTVPIIVHQPASISPSPCPRLQTFHSPEVYVHPNYFVPNNNHYFYYLTRLNPKPVDVQTIDSPNICANPSDYPYYVVPTENLRFTEEHMEPSENLRIETEDGPDTTTLNDSKVSRDQQYLTDAQFEGPEDIHAAYRYPGYGFGHPVYNVPLCALIPSASLQTHPNTPWSVVHLQKRRRRRRKGYAEYAIIPKKKNLPNTDNKNAEIQISESKTTLDNNVLGLKKVSDLEKPKKSRQDDLLGKDSLKESNIQQNRKSATEIKHETISNSANEEVFLYANNLVRNIIKQAHQKLTEHIGLSSSSYRGTSGNSIPFITPVNLKDYEQDHIIIREILQYILNKVVDESNVTDQVFGNHISAEEDTKLEQEEKNIQIEKSLFPEQGELFNNADAFNKLETVEFKNETGSNIFHESIERHMLDHYNDNRIEINNMFTKLAINMDVPDVHKKIFTRTESDNNTSQEKPKEEIHQVISDQCEPNEHLANLNVIFKSAGMSESEATFEHNGNNAKATYRNTYSEEQNSNRQNQGINVNGSQRKNVNKFEEQSKNDQNQSQSELSSYCKNSNDDELQTSNLEAAKETIVSENTYPATHSTHLHNENIKCYDNSPSSQYSFVLHSVSSDTLIRETEMELNKIHQLTSNSNQSIYKLAYDENITDQSETEETDIGQAIEKEEPTCPKSCKNLQGETRHSEILVHEIDNASDAGSEDVELLPHRYESDTAKGCNKHVYVNNLSLAVELLRTRESLPYDDEFKRIVDDDTENKAEERNFQRIDLNHPLGSVNRGFIEDLGSFSSGHSNTTCHERSSFSQSRNIIQNCPQSGEFRLSTADSGVQSEDSGDEIGEEAKETFGKQNDAFCTSTTNANYRRFGAQTGQRFNIYTPRANVMNPCFCCIII